MNKQPTDKLDDDFLSQAIQVIHFWKSVSLSQENEELLRPFIERVNEKSLRCIAPLFLKMYNTENLDGPCAEQIGLMLEPMPEEQRKMAYDEAVKLLEEDCGGPLPAYHLSCMRNIFCIE